MAQVAVYTSRMGKKCTALPSTDCTWDPEACELLLHFKQGSLSLIVGENKGGQDAVVRFVWDPLVQVWVSKYTGGKNLYVFLQKSGE